MAGSVRNLIFDIGQVLYQWDLRKLFDPLITDPVERDWFLAHVVTVEWHFRHDAGEPWAAMVAERQAKFPDHADWIAAYAERFNETLHAPVDGMIALVERLHARAVPLYAISNFGADAWAGFRPTAPVFERFADIVISGQERLMKPDPAIYRLALARFGVAAEESLFIDDRAENIAAARALGLHGHLFTNATSLETELRALAIL